MLAAAQVAIDPVAPRASTQIPIPVARLYQLGASTNGASAAGPDGDSEHGRGAGRECELQQEHVRSTDMSLEPQLYAAFEQGGAQVHQEIDVGQGDVFLRTGIYDTATARRTRLRFHCATSPP